MKVLVTGATGFIGRYVVEELLRYNHEVIASSLTAEEAKSCDWLEQVEFIECDLNKEQEDFFTFFNEPDILIHLAWEGLPNYKDLFHFEKNLFYNYRFLKNMVEHGLKDITVTGTCLEYGMQNGVLTEGMETKPDNPYALAKDTLRKFLYQLQKKNDFILKWIRLFYMYGKGQNAHSVLSQLQNALDNGEREFNMSGGEQRRDYLPVEKVAEYIVKIAMQKQVVGIVNCCSGVGITIKELVENYLKQKGKSIHLNLGYYPYPDFEPMAFWGDPSKLNTILDGNI
jgi:nucleoside-diphosphate-sugar epimerase